MKQRVEYCWDNQQGCEEGWVVKVYDVADGCELTDHSEALTFPVDVLAIGQDDAEVLRRELEAAYPNAEIVRTDEV